MRTQELTGQTRLRPHHRVFAPTLYVLQVEERITRKIICPVLQYDAVRYVWRDAKADDVAVLNAIDPHKPVIDELRRTGQMLDVLA